MGTFSTNILPSNTGQDLGSPAQRWDAYLQTLNIESMNNVRIADSFSGSDWGAKVTAADLDLGSTAGEIWVSQAAGTSAIASGITLSDDHVLRFVQGGTYALGSQVITMGDRSAILCGDIRSTILSYSGTAYAIEIDTVTKPTVEIGVSLGSSALGALRIRNTSNSFETRAQGRLYIQSPSYTATQLGVLLQADNANSAVYHCKLEVYAHNVGVPVRFKSLVNNQGANANWIYIESNLHAVAVDMMDGSDNVISGNILGCQGLTGGVGIRLGAAGSGGYGVANCVFGPLTVEQGGTSTAISVTSGVGLTLGCGNSIAYGNFNDSTQFSDANATSTILVLQQGGGIRNPIIAGNILPLGGAASPASVAVKRSGTVLESKLGNDSAYAEFKALKFTSTVATGTAPLAVASTTLVTNLNAQQVNGRTLEVYVSTLTPALVAANTVAAQSVTVTGATTAWDILQVIKPTEQAGLAVIGARVTAPDTVSLQFANCTAVGITPTAGEVYRFVVVY